jgi:GNAT superfamily N-acetyltransferase
VRVGRIVAKRRKTAGRVYWYVDRVHVEEEEQRRGIGTALYEAAADEACRRGSGLVSRETSVAYRSLQAEGWWKRQVREGRARHLAKLGALKDVYVIDCPPGRLARPYTIREDVRGAHHGQVDVTLFAEGAGEVVGYLDYSEYRGRVLIERVAVEPGARRRGVGAALVRHLVRQYGYEQIEWGYQTEDGAALKAAMDRELRLEKNMRLLSRHSGDLGGLNAALARGEGPVSQETVESPERDGARGRAAHAGGRRSLRGRRS